MDNPRNKLAWMAEAACLGKPPGWFYPDTGKTTEAAKKVCETCPVQEKCLAHAFTYPENHGVWGGKTEDERRSMKRKAKTAEKKQREEEAKRKAAASYRV